MPDPYDNHPNHPANEVEQKECPVCSTPINIDKDFCGKRCCEQW